MLRLIASAASVSLLLAGCSTYRSQLHRGQRYYEENQYEAALALWRDLEADQDSLTPQERARYAYFRGMTDYRLGYRSDARYWLSLAQAGEQLHPASLGVDQKARMEGTLGELNADVVSRLTDPGERIPRSGPRSTDTPSPGWGPSRVPANDTVDGPATGPADVGDPAGTTCTWSTECPQGYICQDQVCVEL